VFEVLDELRIVGLLTEILSVRLDSIEAAVCPGDDRREHLPLGA
jgi:hypothetical protein